MTKKARDPIILFRSETLEALLDKGERETNVLACAYLNGYVSMYADTTDGTMILAWREGEEICVSITLDQSYMLARLE